MSFSLPLQALANFQLVISVPGDHPLPPTFELKPLPPNADLTPTFPTSLQVRARETGQGLTFELTGDHSFCGQFTSPLPTPPESLLGSPSQSLLHNMALDNDYFGADLSANFPSWSHFNDLPDDAQTSALLCTSISPESIELGGRSLPMSDFGLTHPLPFADPPFGVPSTTKHFLSTKETTGSPEDFSPPFNLPYSSPLHHGILTPIDSSTPIPETPLSSPDSSNASSPTSTAGGPTRTRSRKSSASSSSSGSADNTKKPETPTTQSNRPRPFACRFPGCERVFTSNYTRETHMLTHRPKRKQTYQCTVGCNALFSRKHDRWRHEVSQHGKPSQWTCSRCNQYFSSEKSLSVHNCDRPMRLQWKNQNSSGG
ncbi:hypothetical protein L218DRAFT_717586 [Marasmius fiardii PR-910]|nr:hypothetical protein L218DRAFT_717586 [Marasmius fiardii PR-910]